MISDSPSYNKEAIRQKALDSYDILDTIEEKEYDDLVLLASEICDTPISLISLVDNNRQWFKAKKGIDVEETPRSQSFCAYAIIDPWQTMVIDDARIDHRFANNPLVTGEPNIIFYAGVPLVNEDGEALGTLCVIDNKKHQLTESQLNALKVVAQQVMQRLEYRRKLKSLEDANAALLESNMLIQKFARTTAHDIKNPLSSILLNSQVMQLAFGKYDDNRNRDIAERTSNVCKQLVVMVNEMLDYAKSPSRLLQDQTDINLSDLLAKVIELVEKPETVIFDLPKITVTIRTSGVALEQIFLNLITNAIRYNDKPEIKVDVRFSEDTENYYFKVSDNGRGIPSADLKRIFEDRFTSGIPDRYNQTGTGIGLHTVHALLKKLNGNIHAESVPGVSSTFSFWIRK